MRLLLVITFVAASAAGFHFSGTVNGFYGDGASSEKLRAVKPEFSRKKVEEPAPYKPDYTFFKTLNDPTMTQYVDLNGRLMPTALSPEKTTLAKIVATPPFVKKADKPEPVVTPEKKQDQKPEIEESLGYVVQVSSFRDEVRAGVLKSRLRKNGFDAFLMQTELADHEGIWHRVFLGRYVDEWKAQEAANLARNDYKLNAVVVRKTN